MRKKTIFYVLVAGFLLSALPSSMEAQDDRARRRTPVVVAVEKVGPAVVNIQTKKLVPHRRAFSSPFDLFFGVHGDEYYNSVENSLGSGVIIHPEGYIITNEHVVRRATDITVHLSDKSTFNAELISSSLEMDLALLKIDRAKPFVYAQMADSDEIMVGEPVIAMGNPFGLENSVTTGVISATNRSVRVQNRETYKSMLQTDALINFGNSGGALLNINGKLIGINTAIQAQGQGIGFAIPSNAIRNKLCSLTDFHNTMPYSMGIGCGNLTEAASPAGKGLGVIFDKKGTPAWNAGIRKGDILLQVNGENVTNLFDFNLALRKSLGKELSISYARGGEKKSARLSFPPITDDDLFLWKTWGIHVAPLTDEIREDKGYRKETYYENYEVGKFGVLIDEIVDGKPASLAGLEVGDIVVIIGEYGVETDMLVKILKKYKSTRQDIFIFRNRRIYRSNIEIP